MEGHVGVNLMRTFAFYIAEEKHQDEHSQQVATASIPPRSSLKIRYRDVLSARCARESRSVELPYQEESVLFTGFDVFLSPATFTSLMSTMLSWMQRWDNVDVGEILETMAADVAQLAVEAQARGQVNMSAISQIDVFSHYVFERETAAAEEHARLERIEFKGGNEESSCSICLEKFVEGNELVKLKCMHLYHGGCLLPWMEKRRNCPICRSPIAN